MESGLCVGKLQGSLRPLKERYNSTCLPRSWDQDSLTSLGYTKARRAQTSVMRKGLIFGEELPGTCCRLQMAWGPNAPNIPKTPKNPSPRTKEKDRGELTRRGVSPYLLLASQAKRPPFKGYSDSKSPNVSTAIMNIDSVGWKGWPAAKERMGPEKSC